ncbi:MAG: hypothetical protein QOJ29_754, partial [Thermoleophilaceae bacterium]|nr:hypothetical protein [Thermoleophilaceae bacterium]
TLARTLRARGPDAFCGIVILAAAALWIDTVRDVELRRITDLGLVSALPLGAFVALGMATASFALTLRHPNVSTPLALLHLVVLVVMLHGATSLIDQEPAFNVVWRHAGVTDYVMTTGTVNPNIDAYFNWPGFFILAALATRAAGLESALGLSAWAPVAFELLYLPALVVIARAFTADRRLAWIAVWLFYLTNWVGQDYLSPQAMAYLSYLALAAVILTSLSRRTGPDLAAWRERGTRLLLRLRIRRPGVRLDEVEPAAPATAAQRAGLVLICVVVIAATVGSHQLTPWMMLASLLLLVGLRRCTARGLPVITIVLLVAWMTYLATAYLDGHLKPLLGQTLDVQQALAANVGGRLQGSHGHLLVVRLRLVMTALIWGLAIVGAVRGTRRGASSPSHLVLALAPALLAVLQPYGGEMLMRVYLFSLPFAACYAAQALMPSPGRRAWQVPFVLTACGALLLAGFLFTRYGNERTTLFTPAEVRSVDRLYAMAQPGSLLLAVSPNVPWKQRHYADYHFQLLSRQLKFEGPPPSSAQLATAIARYMAGNRTGGAYLIVTRSQKVYDDVLGSQPWGSSTDVERAVQRSPRFSKLFDDGDGRIFVLRRGTRRRTP